MANQYISKVVYNGNTLIDLTSDTVQADKLLEGYTAHGKDGALVTGICTFDSDTSDATVTEDEILSNKTAYARGIKITGKMYNNEGITGHISTVAEEFTIPKGYHDGSGKVSISAVEQAKIIASNIRQNITILGVTGTMSGSENENLQEKTVEAPLGGPDDSGSDLIVGFDEGFTGLSQVTVKKVPYTAIDNSAGGVTVTIGKKQTA